MPSDPLLTVRPATPEDVDGLADLFLAAREAAFPAIPRPAHSAADVRRWLHDRADSAEAGVELWTAEDADAPAGLLLLEDSWLHSLYVSPARTGRGIGTVLLELAKSRRPDGLGLWVFETNEAAQRFYRRHGFGEVRRTDGTDNEERQPDIELAWPDPESLGGLRRRIDAVDDQLALLLADRTRLSARVQRLKEVPGHAGRDPVREAQIVARMARSAPELEQARLAEIMDAVIRAGLDVAD